MIICHPLRLIYIKTKKVGGTSFEIALSKYCGPDCIITPITSNDEEFRQKLGFRSAQNFEDPIWKNDQGVPAAQTRGKFFNHITAAQAQKLVPAKIWEGYRKVAIYRSPFDTIVSRYYWEGGPRTGLDFGEFVAKFPQYLIENIIIAPPDPKFVDTPLLYDRLQEDVASLAIPGLAELMSGIKAKSRLRPESERDIAKIYGEFPRAKFIIETICAKEIAHFGHKIP